MSFTDEPRIEFFTNSKTEKKISDFEQLEDGLYCSAHEYEDKTASYSKYYATIKLRIAYSDRYDIGAYKCSAGLLGGLVTERLKGERRVEEDQSGVTINVKYLGRIEKDELFSCVVLVCQNILQEIENDDYALRLANSLSDSQNAKCNKYREDVKEIVCGFVMKLVAEAGYVYEIERIVW